MHICVKKNDSAFLSKVKLKKDCMKNEYFDEKECYYWLYKYSKYTLTMRLSLGFEYLFGDSEEIDYRIF